MMDLLHGITVLDLTRLLPGNFCTLCLADLGAEVIKVEDPVRGDYIRWMPPFFGEESAYHLLVNRSKKSVCLDLKQPKAKESFLKCLERADVLVESFRPGIMAKLGLDYGTLKGLFPRLVYCAITGYGQVGPFRDRAGHDLNYIGFAGLLSTTKDGAGRPVIPGIQAADLFGGGAMAALGIVSALIRCQRTGAGAFLDISMTDGAAFSQPVALAEPMFEQSQEGSTIKVLTGGVVCYNVYETLDDRFVTLGAIEEKFWQSFVEAVGKPEWKSRQFDAADSSDQSSVYGDLCVLFRQKSMQEWEAMLSKVDTCFGVVQTHAEVLRHPLFQARGLFGEMSDPELGTIPQVMSPIKLDGAPFQPKARAPKFGEHTFEVLTSYGVDSATLEALKRSGAAR